MSRRDAAPESPGEQLIDELHGVGGAEGNRTPDLCSAIAALSHLSYGPGQFGGI